MKSLVRFFLVCLLCFSCVLVDRDDPDERYFVETGNVSENFYYSLLIPTETSSFRLNKNTYNDCHHVAVDIESDTGYSQYDIKSFLRDKCNYTSEEAKDVIKAIDSVGNQILFFPQRKGNGKVPYAYFEED